jgi:hypothetical protein
LIIKADSQNQNIQTRAVFPKYADYLRVDGFKNSLGELLAPKYISQIEPKYHKE